MGINLILCLVLLPFAVVCLPSESSSGEVDQLDKAILEAIDHVSKEIIKGFRSAHSDSDAEEKEQISRIGHSTKEPSTSLDSSSPDHGFQKLKRITPMFSVCDGPIHFNNIEFNGISVGVCISSSGQVIVGEMSLSAQRWSAHDRITHSKNPIMSVAFVDKGKLYVLVADQSRDDGVPINIFEKDFKPDHTSGKSLVSSPYPTVMKVWTASGGFDSKIRLAVSSSPDPRRRVSTYESETKFYSWADTYFDEFASVLSYHVKDICPFSVGGQDYVVIVNYERTPEFPEVDSPVYRFDFDNNQLVIVQTLRFQGAVDCETFELMEKSANGGISSTPTTYLAVANNRVLTPSGPYKNVNSVIYRFSRGQFVPFQVLHTIGATQIKAYEDSSNAFALAVADSTGVKMYQYNGWKFLPASVQSVAPSLGPGVVSLSLGQIGSQFFLISCNPATATSQNVIKLDFEKDEVLKNWRAASLNWCSAARAYDVNKELDKLEEALKDVFFVDQPNPIQLHGDLHLEALNVDIQGLLSAPYVYNHEDNQTLSHRMTHELESLERSLLELEKRIDKANSLLGKALRLDGKNQLVTGQYTFENVEVTCGQTFKSTVPGEPCNIGAISTQQLNGRDVVDIGKKVIRIDRDQTINHPNLTFHHIESASDLTLLGDGLVNGVNISQLVTKTGRHWIDAPVTFTSPVSAGSVEVTGLVNGIKLTNQTVLLKNGDQSISSSIEFTAPVKVTNLQANYVNGRPLSALLSSIVTVDGNHVIRGKKTFKLMDVRGQLNISSSIAGVDLPSIYDNLLWTDQEQTIDSDVIVKQLKVRSNLDVANQINGISLPGKDIVLNNRKEAIFVTAPKTFTYPLTKIDHLHIKGTLNGIGLVGSAQGNDLATQWPEQLDILLKSRSQTIPAHKTVAGTVGLSGHSTVQGTINDVDLSQLEQTVLKYNESNLLSGVWSFIGPVHFLNHVTVRGRVNGVNVSDLYESSFKLRDRFISNLAPNFVFEKAVINGPLNCTSINGLYLEKQLMTRDTPQVITGVKTFNKGLHIKSDFTVTGSFNGIPLNFLNDSLLSTSYQVVQGPKIVTGDLYVNNLITKSLNGINLASELILLNSSRPQMISGRKNLRRIKVSHGLDVQRLNVANNINGVNVNDLFNKTMLYDAPQRVSGMKKFKQIIIPQNSNLDADSVSGYKLRALVDDALYIDSPVPQNVTGEKTFLSPVSFAKLDFYKSFDGVTNHTLRNNWLLQGVDQQIDGNLILSNLPGASQMQQNEPIVIRGNLDIGRLLNGHDVRQLDSSIVKVNEPAIVRGPIKFAGTVTAEADVNLSGKIQGIKLSEEAVLRSQPQVSILGQKTFRSNIRVKDTVTVDGFLDGVSIKDLCDNVVRHGGDQRFRAPLIVTGNVHSPSLSSGGRVSGVDVRQFVKVCVYRDEKDVQVVSGTKHFGTLIVAGNVSALAGFGGVNVTKLNSEYMSLTKDQFITTQMVFEKGVAFHSDVSVDGNFDTQDGYIHMNGNAFNLSQISASTLKLRGDQEITGPIVFKDNVHFGRNLVIEKPVVHGIPFDWLVLKNQRHVVLEGPVDFENVTVNGPLMMADGARVSGVDLSKFRTFSVDATKGSVNIRGEKHFSTVTVNDLTIQGRLSGFVVDKGHILLSSPGVSQEINARAVFDSVKVNSHLESSSINGIKLNHWRSRLVLNGVAPNNTITAAKTLVGPVGAGETWTMKLIDGLKVDDLGEAVYSKRLEVETAELEKRLGFHESKLERIKRFLDHQEQCVDHYRLARKLDGRLLELSSSSGHMIATAKSDANGCADLSVYRSPFNQSSNPMTTFDPKLVASVSFEGSEWKSIVSVSGSTLRKEAKQCVRVERPDHLYGKAVAQIFSLTPAIAKVYPLDSVPYHVTGLKNGPNEYCLLFAGLSSSVMCFSRNGASSPPKTIGISARQFAVTSVTDWHETYVASLTPGEVIIGKWDHTKRQIVVNPKRPEVHSILLVTPERHTHSFIHFTAALDARYLVLAEAKSAKVRGSRPLIRFFRREPVGAEVIYPFIETQQVHEDENIVSISSLTSPQQDLLFLLTSDYSVKVYRLQGASGWQKFDTLSLSPHAGVNFISSGWSAASKGSHWLAVGRPASPEEESGTSVIVETAIGFRPSH